MSFSWREYVNGRGVSVGQGVEIMTRHTVTAEEMVHLLCRFAVGEADELPIMSAPAIEKCVRRLVAEGGARENLWFEEVTGQEAKRIESWARALFDSAYPGVLK